MIFYGDHPDEFCNLWNLIYAYAEAIGISFEHAAHYRCRIRIVLDCGEVVSEGYE